MTSGKNTLTLAMFFSSIQERRKRMLVLVKALLGIENSWEWLVRRYAPWVYRDEIKKLEYMPVYFYFRFAPFPTMCSLRIHGTFENETGEFKYLKLALVLQAFALFEF